MSVQSVHARDVSAALLLVLLGVGLGVATWGIRFDDPFITYRFALNLAQGRGFIFNPEGGERALITTAPLYALLLAIPATLSFDVPTVSNAIGIAALIALALGLFWLGRCTAATAAGWFAGLFALSFLCFGSRLALKRLCFWRSRCGL